MNHRPFPISFIANTPAGTRLFLALIVIFCHAARAVEIGFPADPKAILDVKRNCGAKGDGVTDDTEAIQAAIERCNGPEGSRFLYLPTGIYKVTKPVIFKPPGWP